MKSRLGISEGGVIILIALAVVGIILAALSSKLVDTVDRGYYVVKQGAVSGELTAHMKPGMFWQGFGDFTRWPVSETYYFTNDGEGGQGDASVEVRFNDGATGQISGTCRVDMPGDGDALIALMSKYGYRDYDQLEDKLITPFLRRTLIMTANLMSSKESYSDRRADFFSYARDQIENGIYLTQDQSVTELDPITGQSIQIVRKAIMKDKDGKVLREKSPLTDTQVRLSNFDIKNFIYEKKVQEQISKQQDAIMAVQTAKANAQKAQQDALSAEAQGKADVMKAKYAQEVEAAKAIVTAEQEAKVAVTKSQQLVDVAESERKQAATKLETAKLQKETEIAIGQGEAERRRLVLEADGALEKKLQAYIEAQRVWADAFAKRAVPGVVMAGAGGAGTDGDASSFMQILGAKAARDLAVDLEIKAAAPAPVSKK